MRIRVVDVLDLLSAGESIDNVLAEFAYLEREDILACFAFARAQLSESLPT
jgi:uncharacterized protein (DUF433 family)